MISKTSPRARDLLAVAEAIAPHLSDEAINALIRHLYEIAGEGRPVVDVEQARASREIGAPE
jgi:hypothetical protein